MYQASSQSVMRPEFNLSVCLVSHQHANSCSAHLLTPIPSQKTYDTSSEDDYAGVDDVSDSDDADEPDVEEAEGRVIIEDLDDNSSQITPRPKPYTDYESDLEYDLEDGDIGDIFFDGDGLLEDDNVVVLDDPLKEPVWVPSEDDQKSKKVHWDVSDDDDDDEDDEDKDYGFPDIFVPQASLDPSFRSMVEQDEYRDDDNMSDCFWDFGHQDEGLGVIAEEDKNSSGSSSGYSCEHYRTVTSISC